MLVYTRNLPLTGLFLFVDFLVLYGACCYPSSKELNRTVQALSQTLKSEFLSPQPQFSLFPLIDLNFDQYAWWLSGAFDWAGRCRHQPSCRYPLCECSYLRIKSVSLSLWRF